MQISSLSLLLPDSGTQVYSQGTRFGKCKHCIESSREVVNQIILTHRWMIWGRSSSQPAVRQDLVSKTIFPGDRKVAAIEGGTLQLHYSVLHSLQLFGQAENCLLPPSASGVIAIIMNPTS